MGARNAMTMNLTPTESRYETRFAYDNAGTPCPVFATLILPDAPRRPTQICSALDPGANPLDHPLVTPTSFIGDPNTGVFHRVTFRHESLPPGVTREAIEGEALRNLCRRPATWVRRGGMLACSRDFLAAERLLDRAFMREAARQLDRRHGALIAGIPSRGTLLVRALDDTDLAASVQTVLAAHDQAGPNALSPWSYLLVDGEITGTAEPRRSGSTHQA